MRSVAFVDILLPLRLGQERRETSLLKMMVARQRLDVVLLHHDEADTIGQRPEFVVSVQIKLGTAVE